MKTVPSKIGRRYGYFPSLKNPFTKRYGVQLRAAPLPPAFDARPQCPPVVDQGQTSSCTANSIAGAYEFERMKANLSPLVPSRLFVYWNERSMEGDTSQDDGAFGGDGLMSLETLGVCDESIWPFNPADITVQPPVAAFQAALANKIKEKQVLETITDIKGALVDGHIVPFGITLYESFESDAVAQSGIVPDPQPNEGQLGGHEMCIVGYDDGQQKFIVRNSWSVGWGMAGYCLISYNYIMSSGGDFEVITQI